MNFYEFTQNAEKLYFSKANIIKAIIEIYNGSYIMADPNCSICVDQSPAEVLRIINDFSDEDEISRLKKLATVGIKVGSKFL